MLIFCTSFPQIFVHPSPLELQVALNIFLNHTHFNVTVWKKKDSGVRGQDEGRAPHRSPYDRIRRHLRLDEAIVVSGSEGPANCNTYCATGGKASCRPKCIFMESIANTGPRSIANTGPRIDACIFDGLKNDEVPYDVRAQGCIPFADGMESEVIYDTMEKNRRQPETWMRSYRLDAEVPATYFNFQDFHLVQAGPALEVRERSACVVISNCSPQTETNHRQAMIKTLMTYIDVAYYGSCGNRPWPDDCGESRDQNCSKFEVMQRHVIYLAFENSVSQDYVTEKLYGGLSAGCVTVTYGAPNTVDLAPRGSIINIIGDADVDKVGAQLKSMLADPALVEAKKQVTWPLHTSCPHTAMYVSVYYYRYMHTDFFRIRPQPSHSSAVRILLPQLHRLLLLPLYAQTSFDICIIFVRRRRGSTTLRGAASGTSACRSRGSTLVVACATCCVGVW